MSVMVKPLKVEQSLAAYCVCEKLWRLLEGEVLQVRGAGTEGNGSACSSMWPAACLLSM